MAPHGTLANHERFYGLALLVGFSHDEVKQVAGLLGAAGSGRIERDTDIRNGWVAQLTEVCTTSEITVFEFTWLYMLCQWT